MKVKVKFYSGFENYLKNGLKQETILHINQKDDIRSIITRFLPEDMVGYVGMVLVNKKIVRLYDQVKEGDKIEVFPLMGGG